MTSSFFVKCSNLIEGYFVRNVSPIFILKMITHDSLETKDWKKRPPNVSDL